MADTQAAWQYGVFKQNIAKLYFCLVQKAKLLHSPGETPYYHRLILLHKNWVLLDLRVFNYEWLTD